MRLSLGDKEVMQLHTLLCVCEVNKADPDKPITDTLWKKGPDLSLITMHLCYSCSRLWTEELSAKFAFYTITKLHCGNSNGKLLLEDWAYSIK